MSQLSYPYRTIDNKHVKISAELIATVDSQGYSLESFSAGARDTVWLLLRSNRNSPSWRLLCVSQKAQWELHLECGGESFSFLQPLPGGFLLAESRQDGFDPNAFTYDQSGKPIRSFCIGDGVQSVQTTTAGDIWVSYFDQGTLGNTIARAGLLCFNADGEPIYTFQPVVGLDRILDCYALNVENDDTAWIYYYSPFPIVRIHKRLIDGVWKAPIPYATAFAVYRDTVVMDNGVQQDGWTRLTLQDNGRVSRSGPVVFLDDEGAPFSAKFATARGRLIWFLKDAKIYCADLGHLRFL